jgi:ribosome biogenesis protein ERB1
MLAENGANHSNKRKFFEETHLPELRTNGNLEMPSDEENGWDSSSGDGEVDEFPEIVTDSEDENSDEDPNGNEDSEAESLHIFPTAKTVISDITKHPKIVYPEIEPDYDSDSSTEEVSHLFT